VGSLQPFDQRGEFGTWVEFHVEAAAEAQETARWWLGVDQPGLADRLVVFAQTGADSSQAALWLDDEGRQRIVHLGSGSGSTLAGVIADDPVDFLRLLAIGYPEICDEDAWGGPPESWDEDGDWQPINAPYREWLQGTFGVEILETAHEIVPEPGDMDERGTDDDFLNWVDALQDENQRRRSGR